MLKIRKEQMAAFEKAAIVRFENDLLEHIEEYFPDKWASVGEDQLRRVIGFGLDRAEHYQLVKERDILMYVSLMLYLGSNFDRDMQLPWIPLILNDDRLTPSMRINNANEVAMSYLNQVEGESDEFFDAAINKVMGSTLPESLAPKTNQFAPGYVISLLNWFYPEKCEFLGEAILNDIIKCAVQQAKRYEIANQYGVLLYIGLMFILGSHFDEDPQYPGLSSALQDQSKTTTSAKVASVYSETRALLERIVIQPSNS